MSDAPLPAPLDDFLGNPPARPAPVALRRVLLHGTMVVVRRRRWKRRFIAAAALAGALLLSAGMLWRLSTGAPAVDDRAQPRIEKEPREPPSVDAKVQPMPLAAKPAPSSAIALEWRAFDAAPPQRAALYQQAGDRYVDDEYDLAAALRCYGQAVQTEQADTLQIDTSDNWLVMALKMDQIERRKEK